MELYGNESYHYKSQIDGVIYPKCRLEEIDEL